MTGWMFVDAELEPGEVLLFRRVCTLRRGRRTIGGEVNVTDRRLLFLPLRLEQLVRVRPLAYALADVDHVVVIPPPPATARFAGLPGMPKARAEIDVGDELVVLQLEDAEALARVLELGRQV